MSAALLADEKALDEAIHYALAVDGLSPQAAAAFYHKTQQEILHIYERVEQENVGRFTSKAEATREKNRRRLERVIAQAAEGYETSKKPKETQVFKTDKSSVPGGAAMMSAPTEIKLEGKAPDPRFLNTQLEAIAQLSRLDGAEAPKQVQISQHSLHEVFVNFQNLSDADLATEAALAQLVQKQVLVLDHQPGQSHPVAIENQSPADQQPGATQASQESPSQTDHEPHAESLPPLETTGLSELSADDPCIPTIPPTTESACPPNTLAKNQEPAPISVA